MFLSRRSLSVVMLAASAPKSKVAPVKSSPVVVMVASNVLNEPSTSLAICAGVADLKENKIKWIMAAESINSFFMMDFYVRFSCMI